MSSVLSLYVDQNEGLAKSKPHEICMVIHAVSKLSGGKEAFKGAKLHTCLREGAHDCIRQRDNCASLMLTSKAFVSPLSAWEVF